VETRYFAGLSVEEIAAILQIGPRSVEREWASANIRVVAVIVSVRSLSAQSNPVYEVESAGENG
jgi:ECF sigma factor